MSPEEVARAELAKRRKPITLRDVRAGQRSFPPGGVCLYYGDPVLHRTNAWEWKHVGAYLTPKRGTSR